MTESKPKGVFAAFVAAQKAMSRAIKDTNNPHFKSKYADLASVQDACLPALHDNGFAVLQPIIKTEDGLAVETILLHESGETLQPTCPIPLLLGKSDMQGLGSAITYARRYGLMCLSGVAPDDDDGNKAAEQAPRGSGQIGQKERTISAEQYQELRDLMDRSGTDEGRFLTYLKAPALESLPARDFPTAKSALEGKLQKAGNGVPHA